MFETFYGCNFVFRKPFYMYHCLVPVEKKWPNLQLKWLRDNYIPNQGREQNYDSDFIFSHWVMHFQSWYMSGECWW